MSAQLGNTLLLKREDMQQVSITLAWPVWRLSLLSELWYSDKEPVAASSTCTPDAQQVGAACSSCHIIYCSVKPLDGIPQASNHHTGVSISPRTLLKHNSIMICLTRRCSPSSCGGRTTRWRS